MGQTNTTTLGEKRIRTSFNPSNDSLVDTIKQKSAELLNYVDEMCLAKDGEQARLKALALTSIEEAAMWSVKAVTY